MRRGGHFAHAAEERLTAERRAGFDNPGVLFAREQPGGAFCSVSFRVRSLLLPAQNAPPDSSFAAVFSLMNVLMTRIAVIEDDVPTSNQLRGWIAAARPGIQVDQWFTRDEAEAALQREHYDLVVLDIELGRERNAGVALINLINKKGRATPVLVVSAMPAAIYRSIMKALDAWDYLQKTSFEEADFVDTLLDILRATRDRPAELKPAAVVPEELSLDPLRQGAALWRGQRINLPLTAQRILLALYQRRGEVVSYEELYGVVKSGRTRDNIRKHVSTIREAFREIDPGFEAIDNIPMRGFSWANA